MNGVFMQTPKIMKKLATLQIEFANRLALMKIHLRIFLLIKVIVIMS